MRGEGYLACCCWCWRVESSSCCGALSVFAVREYACSCVVWKRLNESDCSRNAQQNIGSGAFDHKNANDKKQTSFFSRGAFCARFRLHSIQTKNQTPTQLAKQLASKQNMMLNATRPVAAQMHGLRRCSRASLSTRPLAPSPRHQQRRNINTSSSPVVVAVSTAPQHTTSQDPTPANTPAEKQNAQSYINSFAAPVAKSRLAVVSSVCAFKACWHGTAVGAVPATHPCIGPLHTCGLRTHVPPSPHKTHNSTPPLRRYFASCC